jgi:ribose transport system substrate-binding protein
MGGEHAGVAKALLGTQWRERWNGPSSETEVDRQIALVQQAIRQRDCGLILSPDHPVALTTAVRMAAEQGMPVVIVDATLNLPPSLDVDYLLNDEQQTGELAANRIGSILHGHGTVAVLGETPALMSTVARDEALRRSMAAHYPGITVLDPMPGRFRTNLAEQDTEELLASHPDLNGIDTGDARVLRGTQLRAQRPHRVAFAGDRRCVAQCTGAALERGRAGRSGRTVAARAACEFSKERSRLQRKP